MRRTIISVVGGKKSGKTTTLEILTRELTRRGYDVAVVKHVSEPHFTIDTAGKDTWRYAQSGAKTVVAASTNEIATIEKNLGNLSLRDILRRCGNADVIFVEGFRKLLAKNSGIPKIVVAKSAQDIEEAVEEFEPVLAFTGPFAPKNADLNAPYVDVLKNARKIADLVEDIIKKQKHETR